MIADVIFLLVVFLWIPVGITFLCLHFIIFGDVMLDDSNLYLIISLGPLALIYLIIKLILFKRRK